MTDTSTTQTVFVGVTDHQGRGGTNQAHIVTNQQTWQALCGKVIAECWESPVAADATCVTCKKSWAA